MVLRRLTTIANTVALLGAFVAFVVMIVTLLWRSKLARCKATSDQKGLASPQRYTLLVCMYVLVTAHHRDGPRANTFINAQ